MASLEAGMVPPRSGLSRGPKYACAVREWLGQSSSLNAPRSDRALVLKRARKPLSAMARKGRAGSSPSPGRINEPGVDLELQLRSGVLRKAWAELGLAT